MFFYFCSHIVSKSHKQYRTLDLTKLILACLLDYWYGLLVVVANVVVAINVVVIVAIVAVAVAIAVAVVLVGDDASIHQHLY